MPRNASAPSLPRLFGIALCAGLAAMTAPHDRAEAQSAPEVPSESASAAAGCSRTWPAVPVAVLPQEPPARLVVDEPVASQLAEGRVVIRYCADNVRILPVFGEAALKVSPRLGHVHVTVDHGPYRWLDTSGQPIVVNKLPPGPHSILIELVDPVHRTIDRRVVRFVVPDRAGPH